MKRVSYYTTSTNIVCAHDYSDDSLPDMDAARKLFAELDLDGNGKSSTIGQQPITHVHCALCFVFEIVFYFWHRFKRHAGHNGDRATLARLENAAVGKQS